MFAIERERIPGRKLLNFTHPADNRPAIRMIQVKRAAHLFAQLRRRAVIGSRPALFQHNIAFRQNHLVGEDDILHTVGFKPHDGL